MSEVRLAATVILARPPLEVYLTRRSARSAFAPDAYVFPGGTTTQQDGSPAAASRTLGLSEARLAREFRAAVPPQLASSEPAIDPEAGRALLVAALRELFEEAGVLLARDAGGEPLRLTERQWQALAEERRAVRADELGFADFLARHRWFADAGALRLFSHWITPPGEPRRYNTHFFLAAAPADQIPLADAYETHDGIWIAPADALARYRAKTLHLVYPTIKHLERLSAFASVGAAMAHAGEKRVLTIMPLEVGQSFRMPPELEDAW